MSCPVGCLRLFGVRWFLFSGAADSPAAPHLSFSILARWPLPVGLGPLTLRTVLARNLLIELPFMHPLAKYPSHMSLRILTHLWAVF